MRHRLWIIGLATCLLLACSGIAIGQEPPDPNTVMKLSLDQAIEFALKFNEERAIAYEGIESAKATLMQNTSAGLPQITGIVGYEHNLEQPTQELDMSGLAPLFQAMNLPPPPNSEIPLVYKHNWNFTLDVKQNIYTFGRLGTALRVAKQYKKIAEENARLTDDQVILQVEEAYYQVMLAKEALQIAVENYEITEKTFANVEQKFKSGIRSEFDMLQIQAELAGVKPGVIQAETAVALSKMNLLRLIALPLGRDIDVTETFVEYFPSQGVDELLSIAQSNRKEVRLSEMNIEMDHMTGNIYISDMLPILDANMAYTYNGASISDEDQFWPEGDDDWQTFWTVGVTFTWPLFDGLKSVGKIRQYRAEERIGRLQKLQLLKGIELEITQLVREFNALKERLAASKDLVTVAEKAHNLASIRFDSGLGTSLERGDAKLMLTRAKVGLARTLYEINVMRAKLKRALGKELF